jgi:AcrR family transcriptional regulator
MTKPRRTQAERRAETRAAVLESACRLFGTKGYAQTSLEEIAAACGLTIRPIYHYFGNKLALFAAVNDVMEERILASIQGMGPSEASDPVREAWRAFLELCRDPEFRQIVLIDSPIVLGRERWAESSVSKTAGALLRRQTAAGSHEAGELATRMLVAALAEAALTIAESDDPERLSGEADEIVVRLLGALAGGATA